MSKSPIIGSPRFFQNLWLFYKEWRAIKKAKKARRSSGHLDPSARSAEFHRLRERQGSSSSSSSVTIVRGNPERKQSRRQRQP